MLSMCVCLHAFSFSTVFFFFFFFFGGVGERVPKRGTFNLMLLSVKTKQSAI